MIALLKIDGRYFLQMAFGESMPFSNFSFVIAANDLRDHEGNDHDYTGANHLFGIERKECQIRPFNLVEQSAAS